MARRSRAWLAPCAVFLVACGARTVLPTGTPLDDDDAGDAGADVASERGAATVPYGAYCYEGAASSGVSCHGAGASGAAGVCTTQIDCEGHVFRAECEDGLCHCINEGYGQCWCQPLAADACGAKGNCCYRP